MSASCGACGKFSNSREENSLHVFLLLSLPCSSCPQNFYFPKFPLAPSLVSVAFASFLLPFVLVSSAVGIGNEVYLGQISRELHPTTAEYETTSIPLCPNRPRNSNTP